MPPRHVYLLRHTRVATPELCYGHHDVGLADTFAAEAERIRAGLLPDVLPAARVITSPASRCQRLAAALGSGAATDDRLREMYFGAWEGRPWAELPRAELDPWMADYVNVAPPAGETFGQLQARAAATLEELVESEATGPVVLVTHGGVIRALVAHVLGLPLAHAFRLVIDYGSSTRLAWQPARWQVDWVNRTFAG